LVDVPVPAEPRVPTDPEAPDVLAERWFAAASDEARRDIILDVLAGIGMGVYTTDGTPILYGAERSEDDPWLYDYEVAILASDPTTATPTSFDDLTVTLAAVISTADGQALTSADLADAVAAAVTTAVNDPSDPRGSALRLARELELRASGQDLREAVPVDAPLEPLAAALIEWDILVPFAAAARASDPSTAMRDGWVATAPGFVLAAGPPPVSLARAVTDVAPRTAQGCTEIIGQRQRGEWSLGRLGAGFLVLGGRAIRAGVPSQALHSLLLRYRLRIREVDSTWKDFHYAHSASETSPLFLKLRVVLDAALPDRVVACGPLAGFKLPRNEPVAGATVAWVDRELAEHGSIDCGAACTTTDEQGEVTWRFTPRQEPAPTGLGPERDETVGLAVGAKAVLSGPSGGVPLSVSMVSREIKATWHREYRFELEVDSEIKGGDGVGAVRGTATAKGRIPLSRNEEGSELRGEMSGEGILKVRTTPLRANGCLGQVSTSGSGFVDWVVDGVVVSPPPEPVVGLIVAPGPTLEYPDRLTSPKCGRKRKSTTKFSTWESFFSLSHQRDLVMVGRGGYQIIGFVWQANDDTFDQGGRLASMFYPEGCPAPSKCRGETRFTVWVYPVGD